MNIIKNVSSCFYQDKPLFGMDIERASVRVMQLDTALPMPRVIGYGSAGFEYGSIDNGVIVGPEAIAAKALQLFGHSLRGMINTGRVAMSLPSNKALTRTLRLPLLSPAETEAAVQTEAAQYLPDLSGLYLDYSPLRHGPDGTEMLIVAVPRNIVDSYLTLAKLMGLELVLLETGIIANARLLGRGRALNSPAVLVDFGADSTDVTILRGGPVVTSSVPFGDDTMTLSMAKALHMTPKDVAELRRPAPSDETVSSPDPSVVPLLEMLVREIRRSIRYYQQRYTTEPVIGQVVVMGGGRQTGLLGYLGLNLDLPVHLADLAEQINFGSLPPVRQAERMAYVTAAGLALAEPKELF